MKRIIIFTLFLMCANIAFTESSALVLKKVSKIYMKGYLNSAPSRSTSSPLEVYQANNDIYVCFLSNMGRLNVIVVNQDGTQIYQQTVNATGGNSLTISTGSWQNGNYAIYIADKQGGIMGGEFSIEW